LKANRIFTAISTEKGDQQPQARDMCSDVLVSLSTVFTVIT